MSFERQMKRASMQQEHGVLMDTVRRIHEETKQLTLENQSLFRTIGAIVALNGGEIRIPRDIDSVLAGKQLTSDLDAETNEFVFTVGDKPAPKPEIATPSLLVP